jgi:transposase InsO family protein
MPPTLRSRTKPVTPTPTPKPAPKPKPPPKPKPVPVVPVPAPAPSPTAQAVTAAYLNPKTGLIGATAFANRYHQHTGTPVATIHDALQGVDAYTLNAPVRKHFPRRHVYAHQVDEVWASDLADVSNQAADNAGVTFLVVVVDVFSKYLWVEPITSKSGPAVTAAFQKIFAQGRTPQRLWTDQGKEYHNRDMTALLTKYNVTQYSTHNEGKSVIAERMIRTLRQRLSRYATATNRMAYLDALPEIVASYNHTKHSTIKMTPTEASDPIHVDGVRAALARFWGEPDQEKGGAGAGAISGSWGDTHEEKRKLVQKPNFKVGDSVRIKRQKGVFTKEAIDGWTMELFTVRRVLNTDPYTYELNDLNGKEITGRFYEQEMVRAKTPTHYKVERILQEQGKGKDKKAFVKWLGYPDAFNSWVKASDIVDL